MVALEDESELGYPTEEEGGQGGGHIWKYAEH